MQEIEEADAEFRKAVVPISKEAIDVAFFPVDPRQGTMYEAGANYFILTAKPRILIPMHYFHRAETAVDYARTASCRTTEVIALPGYGDRLLLTTDEDGYLDVSFPSEDAETAEVTDEEGEPSAEGVTAPEEETAGSELPLDAGETLLSEDDPFLESDLPLTSLVDGEDPGHPIP